MPDEYLRDHELCFLLHDFLVELLRAAEANHLFSERFSFRNDADRQAWESSEDVFQWLATTGRSKERAAFLRRIVFPALLSDLLHFIFGALEASRKASLAVAYALLRKPIQESLFVFEVIAADVGNFADHLTENPLLLRSQKAGGLQAHTKRIANVLEHLADERFDSGYLAQLRYDKTAEDGFDGVCNKAVHLVTEHAAIKTEKLNLNFIFSGWDSKLSQWAYMYSRLPYLLSYAQLLVEYVFGQLRRSDSVYTDYMRRRLGASVVLWDANLPEHHRTSQLGRFASLTRAKLDAECQEAGHGSPSLDHLILMQRDGRWPGQSGAAVWARDAGFNLAARLSQYLNRRRR